MNVIVITRQQSWINYNNNDNNSQWEHDKTEVL